MSYCRGGEPGARLVADLGMTISPYTPLRLFCALAGPIDQAFRGLGVDDFAFRKGNRYDGCGATASARRSRAGLRHQCCGLLQR